MAKVSIDAFACSSHPVIVSDSRGRLALCNRAATDLLGCREGCALGRFCWEVVGFRTEDGEPFCSPRCPIRLAARSGRPSPSQRVLLAPAGGPQVLVDLLSFQAHVPDGARVPVLHVMLPADPLARTGRSPGETIGGTSRQLQGLTRREHEVLQLMAVGLSTGGMAASLCISEVTVRNHVQSILRKLHVHGRLEAVLALMQGEGRERDPRLE